MAVPGGNVREQVADAALSIGRHAAGIETKLGNDMPGDRATCDNDDFRIYDSLAF